VKATVDTLALYLLDTVKLGEQWELTAGIRYDHAESEYRQSVPPASSFSRTDDMPSWRAALVYKPRKNGSIYVAAGTSFNPSAEQLSLSAATANVAPEKNMVYEIGTKWDLFEDRLALSGALFRDEKTNARTPDPNNPLLNVLGGNQRAQGIDLGATGQITSKWKVFTGYTYTDSKVVSSTTAAQVGNPLVNAPKHTFSLWTTYELPWNLEIGFGSNAISSRNASLTADTATGIIKQVPGYVIFNAMVKYHVNKDIDVQLNLDNIGNKYYYDGIHPAHIIPGEGRTLMISTSFRF
jgi:catecholate siderophore receptor